MSTSKPTTSHIARRVRHASALLLTAGTLTAGVIAAPAWAPTCTAGCGVAPPAAAR